MEGGREGDREPSSRQRGQYRPHQGQSCCFYKEASEALVPGGEEDGNDSGVPKYESCFLQAVSFLSLGAFRQRLEDILAMALKQDFHLK